MNTTLKIYNATELYQRENSLPSIPSFSRDLDSVLGVNGLQLCAVTEVVGLPGSGKTQLCLQLCASIQIPESLGGLNAEALYIDTNTNFTASRFKEILSASLLRCQQLLDISLDTRFEDSMKKLHTAKAIGLEKFCAYLHTLPRFIADHPHVKLIVIDSITFPFKVGMPPKKRTGLLFRQMAELQRLAVEKQIAVIVTNEMSTRVGLSGGPLVGSMGDAWASRCNVRVLLSSDFDSLRLAVPLKSPGGSRVAQFQITCEGIRDAD